MPGTFNESDPEWLQPSVGARDTFVVRIWSSNGSDLVRGHIQHIRSRQRVHFASRERLLSFIQDHLPGVTSVDAEADR
jgi:hypothetical protein